MRVFFSVLLGFLVFGLPAQPLPASGQRVSPAVKAAAPSTLTGISKVKGDLDGDGMADLVWRNSLTGENDAWIMSGSTLNLAAAADMVNTSFQIAGIGDFDGDGHADLLWRDRFGPNVIWFMNGASVRSTALLPLLSGPYAGWTVAAVGDFNGDGKADILWRAMKTGDSWQDNAGGNSVWLMNGGTVASSFSLPQVGNMGWQVVAAGDVNGDGICDLVWRNQQAGGESLWLMNGTGHPSTALLPRVNDPDWAIAGAGDIDGDATADIIWRNGVTGENVAWLMNGGAVKQAVTLPPVYGSDWAIVRISDLDGDGTADFVWHNTTTGSNSVWFFNGGTVSSSAALPQMPSTDWQTAGPP